MRYQASEVRSEVLRAKVATGALVTGRGGAAVDVRGAKKDLDEALRLAEREDWAGAVEILSRVVLPSVVREHPDDPLQQTSALTLARAPPEARPPGGGRRGARRALGRDGQAVRDVRARSRTRT